MRLPKVTDQLVRASKVSTKFANKGKLNLLSNYLTEYRDVMTQVVDLVWERDDIPPLPDNTITRPVRSTLSASAIQCAAKQACAVVRGIRRELAYRIARAEHYRAEGLLDFAVREESRAKELTEIKPNVSTSPLELDSRLVQVCEAKSKSFDGWVRVRYTGDWIDIPYKSHRHLLKTALAGVRTSGVRLTEKDVTFLYKIPRPVSREGGVTLGLDVGQSDALKCSDGQTVTACPHGHTYKTICDKMAHKKLGSGAFKRAARHRENFCAWAIKQLNLANVSQINREDLRYMKARKNPRLDSRSLKHWSYRALHQRLGLRADLLGVRVNLLNPSCTSQRCSVCGWVHINNRAKKEFCCRACGYATDADANAAKNLSLNLCPLDTAKWKKGFNKTGFYWAEYGRAITVPATLKRRYTLTDCYTRLLPTKGAKYAL